MKKLFAALLLSLAAVAPSFGRGAPTLGYLEAQTPSGWVESWPAQGAYCVLYINGVETLGTNANAYGVCQFGYVHAYGTYTVVAYQMTNYDAIETGITARGSVTLSTPSSGVVVIQTK